jgi:hypothetical protein
VNFRCFLIPCLLTLLLTTPLPDQAEAQGADQEVFLHFRHQGVVKTYISAINQQDRFYYSAADLFRPLGIDLEINSGRFLLTGNYLGQGTYAINLDTRHARFGSREITLTADDFIISELGFYLAPTVFYELFDMEFTLDFSNLSLALESPDTMPVVLQRQRQLQRDRMMRTQRELRREFYPLRYNRNQQVFNGGFLDYNLTGNYNRLGSNFVYSTAIGTELAGGDLQGTLFGSVSETATALPPSRPAHRRTAA